MPDASSSGVRVERSRNRRVLQERLSSILPRQAVHRKLAAAIQFGVYNFVRKHNSLDTTPAVAAGLEEKPWGLERVVEMTQAYWVRKSAAK